MTLKIPEGRHKLKLGRSFEKKPSEVYQTFRYDFKPASVEECKESYVDFGTKSEVTVSVPKLDASGDVKDVTLFRGSRKPAQKECLLIFDHNTGEFTLEDLTSNIALKQVRSGEEEKEKNLQYVREIRRKLKKPDQQLSPHKKPEQSPHYKKPEQLSPPVLSQFSSAPMSSSSQQQSADLVMSDDSESSSSDENESDGEQSSENSAGSEDDIAKSLEAVVCSENVQKTPSKGGNISLERDLHLSDSSDDGDD